MIYVFIFLKYFHQCIHDYIQDKALRRIGSRKLLGHDQSMNGKFSIANRKPIRIKFFYIFLNNLTKKKSNIIKGTVENVGKFLSSIINVTSLTKEIKSSEKYKRKYPETYPNSFDNCDLVITVICREFNNDEGTQVNAKAYSFQYNEDPSDLNRPIQGEININNRFIPNHIQDEQSHIRSYFDTILHEIIHIIGFSPSLYDKWIDKASGKTYVNAITKYENKGINNFIFRLH